MFKKILCFVCCLSFILISAPVYAETETKLYGFTFSEEDGVGSYFGSYFSRGESIENEIVTEPGIGFDDDNALKVTHIAGTSYTSYDNAIILDLADGLPAGGVYRIIARFYVPSEGNEGKSTLTGPGIVLNGDYPGAQGVVKFPVDFGNMPVDEWKEIDVTLPMQDLPLTSVHFRFVINDEPKHADVWYIDGIEIYRVGELTEVETPEWDLSLVSLSETYKDYFLFGNAIEMTQVSDDKSNAMYKSYYSAATAGNAMKPAYLAPQKDTYSFSGADTFVEWAGSNGIAVHGHTLVWHSQSADWLNKNDDGTALTRAEAKANLENYITNVAGHFKGKVISWDVVNEAFQGSVAPGTYWKSGLRKNDAPWYMAYVNGADTDAGESGADYIYDAFVFARLADPNAVLYYNDYNEEEPGKRDAMAEMTEELNEQWKTDERNTEPERLLIEGIGMQSHYFTDSLNVNDVESAILRFIRTGAAVSISELDVVFGSYSSYTSRTEPLNADELQKQANLYGDLFKIYAKHADGIERVTIWGLADPMSWRAAGYPLLFNNLYAPKEAFFAVIDAVADAAKPEEAAAGATEETKDETQTPEVTQQTETQAPAATQAEAQQQTAATGESAALAPLAIGIVIIILIIVAVIMVYLKRRG